MIPKYELHSLPRDLADALREHISPSPRLRDLADAAAFLRAKQMATLWSGTELPSLHEVVDGGLAPRMALVSSPAVGDSWAWAKGLVESGKFILVKLFRGRTTLVAHTLWPALVELSPADLEACWRSGGLSTAAYQIATFLAAEGPSNTLRLQEALPRYFPILPRSWKRGLGELEEKLVVFPQRFAEHLEGKDVHTWGLLRPSLAGKNPEPVPGGVPQAVGRLVEAAIRASGVVDARESGRWFPIWKLECRAALSALLREGKVRVASQQYPARLAWRGLAERITNAA